MKKRHSNPLIVIFWIAGCAWMTGCTTDSEEQLSLAGPSSDTLEAVSLLGTELRRTAFSAEEQERLERGLLTARTEFEADPEDPERWIWLGRRLAYLWRYNDAVRVYSEALDKFPAEARLYRHRGHRYITLRKFDQAVADLTKAAELIQGKPDEVELDGAPNPQNIPRSTLHSNIWYHLGLAHYLRGEFEQARVAYQECMKVSTNDDMLVATTDWLYMTYRRLGQDGLAKRIAETIVPDMEILENGSYHRRILMYKGDLDPEEILDPADASALDIATQGYGVGNWYLYNDNKDRAVEIFRRVVGGSYWSAFGYIAAEADLSRIDDRNPR